jgi:transposase
VAGHQGLGPDLEKKVLRASEQDRPDVAEDRRRWREEAPTLDPERLVFIDETWTTTNMTRLRGRAPSGVRLVMAAPRGHWKTTTFDAALRADGLTAPLVVDGAINGEMFEAYIRQFVAPTLAPGDVVVMDNLAAHKRAGVREAIEAAGCRLLFLPPYSPDFNPIEQAFSKVKAALRKLARRTVDGLFDGIGEALSSVTPADAVAYIRHSGYVLR